MNYKNTFDVVIATRNRCDALKISIPSILSESRQPEKIIIVDSSDNHEHIKELMLNLTSRWNGDLIILYDTPPSSSRQRNIGLDYVTSDVVIFPDDDSIIIPGAFEAMMRIYDLDTTASVAGVCSAEAVLPPDGLLVNKNAYKLKISDRLRKQIAKIRDVFERHFIPDALLKHGRSLLKKHDLPTWLEVENAVPVEYMTGFRMSFRSAVIKKYKFTEVFTGYCLAEDIGASFLALRDGLLIGARNAHIYHHKYPAKRSNGYLMGLVHIINIAYVLSRSMPKFNFYIVAIFYVQSLYKLTLYCFSPWSCYGRARIKGSIRGLLIVWKIFTAKGLALDNIYTHELLRAKKYKD